jgi:hypothetical protein
MSFALPGPLFVAGLSIFLFLALCGALVLVILSMRKPTTFPLAIAAGIVVFATVVVAVAPVNVPAVFGLILALIAVAIGVIGGNPVTRHVLHLATGSRVRETADGGILVAAPPSTSATVAAPELEPMLRGGTTIGYLERLAIVVAIVAGFPEAIAVVVAVKGIGRFSELAAAEARERFIIGTLASLLWACVLGGLVRLAIW